MAPNMNVNITISNSNTTPSPYHYAITILLSLHMAPAPSPSTTTPTTPAAVITLLPNLDPILHLIVPLCPPIANPYDPTYPQLLDSIRTLFASAAPSSHALADQLNTQLELLIAKGPSSLVSSLTPLLDRLHSHSYLYSWLRNFLTRIHMCEFVVVDLHAALVEYVHPATQVRFMSLETARAWVENATKVLQSSLSPTSTSTSTPTSSPPPPPTTDTLAQIHEGTTHILTRFPDQAPAHYLAALVATLHGRATQALDHLTLCEALTRSTADFASSKPDSLLHQKCWRALTRALLYLKLDWAHAARECLHVALNEANFALDVECAAVAKAHLGYLQMNSSHEAAAMANGEEDKQALGALALGSNVSEAVARLGAGVFELHAVLVLVREALVERGPCEAERVLETHVRGIALVPADQKLVDLERTHVDLHRAFLACDWAKFDAVADAYEERASGISEERGAAKQLHRLALMRGHAAIRRRQEWRAVEYMDSLGEVMEAQCIRLMAYMRAEAWGPAFDLVAFRCPSSMTTTTDPWSLLYSILQRLVQSRFRTTTPATPVSSLPHTQPQPQPQPQPQLADLDLTSTLAAIQQIAPTSWIRSLILGHVCMNYTQLAAGTADGRNARFTHGDVCAVAWQTATAVHDKYWLMYLGVDPECASMLVRAGVDGGEAEGLERAREDAAKVLRVARAVF